MTPDVVGFLQSWYREQCDGDWEHQYGVEIGTLDNPGWRLVVDLVGTELEGISQERKTWEQSPDEWMDWWSDGVRFEAACGPISLVRALSEFHTFATQTKDD
jgi:hypothetical protein